MKAKVGDKIHSNRNDFNGRVVSIRSTRVAPYYVKITKSGYPYQLYRRGNYTYISGRDFDVIKPKEAIKNGD